MSLWDDEAAIRAAVAAGNQAILYSADPLSPTPFSIPAAGTGRSVGEVQLAQQIVQAPSTSPLAPYKEPAMSLLGDLVRVAAPIAGAVIGGPVGAVVGQLGANMFGGSATPGSGVATMAALPSIGATGAVVGTTVRAGIAGARAVIASARYYCAKYPGWCISIGGLGAVQGMVQNGQLPVHRRRRARGISASEFRGFRKVHKVLSGFCAPKMRIRRKR